MTAEYLVSLFLTGVMTGFLISGLVVYWQGDRMIHRFRYKVWTLPCPNCRDDETDQPTGEVTPDNDMLRRMAQSAVGGTESGELPTFPCQVCNGTKAVSYEFPRHKPPTINERKMITSKLPQQMSTRRRRRTV